MTVAVCLKCGAFKVGALTWCSKCHFEPETKEDQAKSIILSDHHIKSPEDLEKVSAGIAAGHPFPFPLDLVESYKKLPDVKFGWSFRLGVWAFVLFLGGAIAGVYWLIMRFLR